MLKLHWRAILLYVLGVYEICCTEKPLKELPNTKGDGQLLGTFSTLIGSLNTCVYTIKHVLLIDSLERLSI